MANDDFRHHASGLTSPARHAAAITPHDTNELPHVTRGIYVGVTGDLEVVTINGETVVFVGVPAGMILPVQAKIVKADNTDADSLVAMW